MNQNDPYIENSIESKSMTGMNNNYNASYSNNINRESPYYQNNYSDIAMIHQSYFNNNNDNNKVNSHKNNYNLDSKNININQENFNTSDYNEHNHNHTNNNLINNNLQSTHNSRILDYKNRIYIIPELKKIKDKLSSDIKEIHIREVNRLSTKLKSKILVFDSDEDFVCLAILMIEYLENTSNAFTNDISNNEMIELKQIILFIEDLLMCLKKELIIELRLSQIWGSFISVLKQCASYQLIQEDISKVLRNISLTSFGRITDNYYNENDNEIQTSINKMNSNPNNYSNNTQTKNYKDNNEIINERSAQPTKDTEHSSSLNIHSKIKNNNEVSNKPKETSSNNNFNNYNKINSNTKTTTNKRKELLSQKLSSLFLNEQELEQEELSQSDTEMLYDFHINLKYLDSIKAFDYLKLLETKLLNIIPIQNIINNQDLTNSLFFFFEKCDVLEFGVILNSILTTILYKIETSIKEINNISVKSFSSSNSSCSNDSSRNISLLDFLFSLLNFLLNTIEVDLTKSVIILPILKHVYSVFLKILLFKISLLEATVVSSNLALTNPNEINNMNYNHLKNNSLIEYITSTISKIKDMLLFVLFKSMIVCTNLHQRKFQISDLVNLICEFMSDFLLNVINANQQNLKQKQVSNYNLNSDIKEDSVIKNNYFRDCLVINDIMLYILHHLFSDEKESFAFVLYYESINKSNNIYIGNGKNSSLISALQLLLRNLENKIIRETNILAILDDSNNDSKKDNLSDLISQLTELSINKQLLSYLEASILETTSLFSTSTNSNDWNISNSLFTPRMHVNNKSLSRNAYFNHLLALLYSSQFDSQYKIALGNKNKDNTINSFITYLVNYPYIEEIINNIAIFNNNDSNNNNKNNNNNNNSLYHINLDYLDSQLKFLFLVSESSIELKRKLINDIQDSQNNSVFYLFYNKQLLTEIIHNAFIVKENGIIKSKEIIASNRELIVLIYNNLLGLGVFSDLYGNISSIDSEYADNRNPLQLEIFSLIFSSYMLLDKVSANSVVTDLENIFSSDSINNTNEEKLHNQYIKELRFKVFLNNLRNLFSKQEDTRLSVINNLQQLNYYSINYTYNHLVKNNYNLEKHKQLKEYDLVSVIVSAENEVKKLISNIATNSKHISNDSNTNTNTYNACKKLNLDYTKIAGIIYKESLDLNIKSAAIDQLINIFSEEDYITSKNNNNNTDCSDNNKDFSFIPELTSHLISQVNLIIMSLKEQVIKTEYTGEDLFHNYFSFQKTQYCASSCNFILVYLITKLLNKNKNLVFSSIEMKDLESLINNLVFMLTTFKVSLFSSLAQSAVSIIQLVAFNLEFIFSTLSVSSKNDNDNHNADEINNDIKSNDCFYNNKEFDVLSHTVFGFSSEFFIIDFYLYAKNAFYNRSFCTQSNNSISDKLNTKCLYSELRHIKNRHQSSNNDNNNIIDIDYFYLLLKYKDEIINSGIISSINILFNQTAIENIQTNTSNSSNNSLCLFKNPISCSYKDYFRILLQQSTTKIDLTEFYLNFTSLFLNENMIAYSEYLNKKYTKIGYKDTADSNLNNNNNENKCNVVSRKTELSPSFIVKNISEILLNFTPSSQENKNIIIDYLFSTKTLVVKTLLNNSNRNTNDSSRDAFSQLVLFNFSEILKSNLSYITMNKEFIEDSVNVKENYNMIIEILSCLEVLFKFFNNRKYINRSIYCDDEKGDKDDIFSSPSLLNTIILQSIKLCSQLLIYISNISIYSGNDNNINNSYLTDTYIKNSPNNIYSLETIQSNLTLSLLKTLFSLFNSSSLIENCFLVDSVKGFMNEDLIQQTNITQLSKFINQCLSSISLIISKQFSSTSSTKSSLDNIEMIKFCLVVIYKIIVRSKKLFKNDNVNNNKTSVVYNIIKSFNTKIYILNYSFNLNNSELIYLSIKIFKEVFNYNATSGAEINNSISFILTNQLIITSLLEYLSSSLQEITQYLTNNNSQVYWNSLTLVSKKLFTLYEAVEFLNSCFLFILKNQNRFDNNYNNDENLNNSDNQNKDISYTDTDTDFTVILLTNESVINYSFFISVLRCYSELVSLVKMIFENKSFEILNFRVFSYSLISLFGSFKRIRKSFFSENDSCVNINSSDNMVELRNDFQDRLVKVYESIIITDLFYYNNANNTNSSLKHMNIEINSESKEEISSNTRIEKEVGISNIIESLLLNTEIIKNYTITLQRNKNILNKQSNTNNSNNNSDRLTISRKTIIEICSLLTLITKYSNTIIPMVKMLLKKNNNKELVAVFVMFYSKLLELTNIVFSYQRESRVDLLLLAQVDCLLENVLIEAFYLINCLSNESRSTGSINCSSGIGDSKDINFGYSCGNTNTHLRDLSISNINQNNNITNINNNINSSFYSVLNNTNKNSNKSSISILSQANLLELTTMFSQNISNLIILNIENNKQQNKKSLDLRDNNTPLNSDSELELKKTECLLFLFQVYNNLNLKLDYKIMNNNNNNLFVDKKEESIELICYKQTVLIHGIAALFILLKNKEAIKLKLDIVNVLIKDFNKILLLVNSVNSKINSNSGNNNSNANITKTTKKNCNNNTNIITNNNVSRTKTNITGTLNNNNNSLNNQRQLVIEILEVKLDFCFKLLINLFYNDIDENSDNNENNNDKVNTLSPYSGNMTFKEINVTRLKQMNEEDSENLYNSQNNNINNINSNLSNRHFKHTTFNKNFNDNTNINTNSIIRNKKTTIITNNQTNLTKELSLEKQQFAFIFKFFNEIFPLFFTPKTTSNKVTITISNNKNGMLFTANANFSNNENSIVNQIYSRACFVDLIENQLHKETSTSNSKIQSSNNSNLLDKFFKSMINASIYINNYQENKINSNADVSNEDQTQDLLLKSLFVTNYTVNNTGLNRNLTSQIISTLNNNLLSNDLLNPYLVVLVKSLFLNKRIAMILLKTRLTEDMLSYLNTLINNTNVSNYLISKKEDKTILKINQILEIITVLTENKEINSKLISNNILTLLSELLEKINKATPSIKNTKTNNDNNYSNLTYNNEFIAKNHNKDIIEMISYSVFCYRNICYNNTAKVMLVKNEKQLSVFLTLLLYKENYVSSRIVYFVSQILFLLLDNNQQIKTVLSSVEYTEEIKNVCFKIKTQAELLLADINELLIRKNNFSQYQEKILSSYNQISQERTNMIGNVSSGNSIITNSNLLQLNDMNVDNKIQVLELAYILKQERNKEFSLLLFQKSLSQLNEIINILSNN